MAGRLSYIGAARFQGFWDAVNNGGTGSVDDTVYGTLFVDGGYAGGTGLTASNGDYWQVKSVDRVTPTNNTTIDSIFNWFQNDWVIYSGSQWIRLPFEDTMASIVMGDVSAVTAFHMSASSDKHVLFTVLSGTTGVHSGSDDFVFNHTNSRVGIGTKSPAYKLDVVGNIVGGTSANSHGHVSVRRDGSIAGGMNTQGGVFNLHGSSTATDQHLTIRSSGNVGIGVADPDELLEVAGDLKVSGGNKLYLYDSGGEHLSSDGTDLTIASGAKINLTATSDVHVPQGVGLVFDTAGTEKIESDGTDFTVNSGGDINLTPGTDKDINIPANIGLTFGDDGEKIEGDGTDLTISAGAAINIAAGTLDLSAQAVDVTLSGSVDALNFDSNTLSIDASNNRVGVGTTSPETALHIQDGSAGTIATTSGALLTLESNEKPKIHFQSPGGYGGSIIFGSPTDNDEGQIDYDHGSDRFLFKTGGNTKMAILGDNVGIGTASPDSSAILELSSTTKGFLPPRLTTTQRDAVSSPAEGLVVYNDTTNALNFYNGSSWAAVGTGGGSVTAINNAAANRLVTIGSTTTELDGEAGLTYDGTTMTVSGSILPNDDVTKDLGSATKRWANIYTGDLHLKNDRGDWTIVEEEDYLTIINNKKGKRYKFVLEEID